MKRLTEIAPVMVVLCVLCGSTPRAADAYTVAAWTGAGGNDDVFNPDNWSWLEGGTGSGVPDDDTDVILDHTAVGTTLAFYDVFPNNYLDSNTVAIGNGTHSVTYTIVSHADTGHWTVSCDDSFAVKNNATADLRNIAMYDLRLLPGSTLRVQDDGPLVTHARVTSNLTVEGHLQLVLPAEPAGECVIAEYGRLTGRFASVAGLPPGWRIEYGSGTDDTIRAVPEPSSVALLAMGALGLAARVRRRRRTAWRLSEPHPCKGGT